MKFKNFLLDKLCKEKTIFIICIISMGISMAYELTSDVPELFEYGDEIFRFGAQVAYSIIASCMFYFLTVYIRNYRRSRRVNRLIEKRLIRIHNDMGQMLGILGLNKDSVIGDSEKGKMATLHTHMEVNVLKEEVNEKFIAIELCENNIYKINAHIDQIMKYAIDYIEDDDIVILDDIVASNFHEFVLMVRRMRVGTYFKNSVFHIDKYFELWKSVGGMVKKYS